MSQKLSSHQKYQLYEEAVQSPEGEIEILQEQYRHLRGKDAHLLREDFGGSSALSVAWVQAHKKNQAFSVDLDPAPLKYAKEVHLPRLNAEQKKRINLYNGNVLNQKTPQADIVAALNFSYYIFKEREELKSYFIAAKNNLKKDGVLFLDLFGGSEAQQEIVEKSDRGSFVYYWDCVSFNPINQHAKFAIHFKLKGKKKIRDVFTYDWRWWSAPELCDLLREVGFKETHILWEGDDDKGGGNGEFYVSKKEENCESWVAYLAALK